MYVYTYVWCLQYVYTYVRVVRMYFYTYVCGVRMYVYTYVCGVRMYVDVGMRHGCMDAWMQMLVEIGCMDACRCMQKLVVWMHVEVLDRQLCNDFGGYT